jgi:hypothetical protein
VKIESFYTVRPNETLSSISRKTGVSISDLAKLNGIRDPNRISVGKKLALNKEAVCGVDLQFLDKEHNPLRDLPYVVRYCGREVSAKTDDTGRGPPIITESPTDEITILVHRVAGDLKEVAKIISGYANKLVTIASPKIKLEAKTHPHPDGIKSNEPTSNTVVKSKTPIPSTSANESAESATISGHLQSAWNWFEKKFGIRTNESTDKKDKPLVKVIKDKNSLYFLDEFTGEKLTAEDYEVAASELGCEVAVIKTIEMVESGGAAFDKKNRPYILYERHVFSRNTNPKQKYDESDPNLSCKTPYHWEKKTKRASVDDLPADQYPNVGGKEENNEFSYQRLMKAYSLDEDAALKACSWGKFQVLGENYSGAFSSVREMVEAVCKNEFGQLKTFISFAKSNHLQKALKDKNWLHIARTYNGKNQKGYDVKLKKQYDALTAVPKEKEGDSADRGDSK